MHLARYLCGGFQQKKKIALHESDIRNARTFSQDLFYPLDHVCVFVPVHGLLKYPTKFGFRNMLGR